MNPIFLGLTSYYQNSLENLASAMDANAKAGRTEHANKLKLQFDTMSKMLMQIADTESKLLALPYEILKIFKQNLQNA